jgi:hypothetical protein
MAATEMTEEQRLFMLRNALLVAGQEMGPDGDHWPVIKSTIHQLMKDWEDSRIERNVFEELKIYYADIVARLEKNLEHCPPSLRPKMDKIMQNIRETYDACFADVDLAMFVSCDEEVPIHIKRAEAIIKTLED